MAASQAAAAASSLRASMSEHRCLIDWKLPIGRPNCSRTFAYAVAVSCAQRAMPAASAAATVTFRSRTRPASSPESTCPAGTSAAVRVTRASGRVTSSAVDRLDVDPAADVDHGPDLAARVAGRHQQPVGPGKPGDQPGIARQLEAFRPVHGRHVGFAARRRRSPHPRPAASGARRSRWCPGPPGGRRRARARRPRWRRTARARRGGRAPRPPPQARRQWRPIRRPRQEARARSARGRPHPATTAAARSCG